MTKRDAKIIRRRWNLSSVLSVAAVLLLFVAFIVPPTGMIDNSVIAAVGEMTAIIALLVAGDAIERGIDAKVKVKDTELELNNPDNKQ